VNGVPIVDKKLSRAVARKPHDAAAVLFGLKFADNIPKASEARGQRGRSPPQC